ncbi:uncharacterized protein [Magallana gigas]|uniref:uncharacterized protein n=1 Tax=Magallana gigas TaxID=29159 RepID=UPI00333F74A0
MHGQINSSSQCRIRRCSKCLGDTKYVCISCPCDLCLQCKEIHVRDLKTIDHNVELYCGEFNNIQKNEICVRHPNKVYGKYCEPCQVPVCDSCSEHKPQVFRISHFNRQSEQKNLHVLVGLKETYRKKQQQHRGTIHTIRSEALFYRPFLLTGAKDDFKTYHTEFSNCHSEMLKKAQKLKRRLDNVLHNFDFKHRCLKRKEKMKTYLTSIQSYEYSYEQSSNTSVKFLLFMKRRCLPQIQHSPCVPHHTSQLAMTKSFNKEDVMESLSGIKLTERRQRGVGNEHLLKLMSSPEFYYSISLKGTNLDHCYHISHVTSDQVWVSEYKNNLTLTNTAGETLHHLKDCRSFHFDSGNGKHTVNSENELLYIDMDNNISKLLKDMKTTTTFIERTDSTWKPQCVYWSPCTGDLLVGMIFYNYYDYDSTCKMWGKVTRYNYTGQLTQTIQEDNTGQKMFRNPICITENNNGDVVVSDFDAVVVTECGGRHRFSYTGHPSGSRLSACGICTDALSHILVCDIRTNTVQMIDRNGQFLSHLLIRPLGIFTPSCLSYDISMHLLWVGSGTNSKICVYQYITRQDSMAGHNPAALNIWESLSEIQVSKTEKPLEGNESLLKLMSSPELLHSLTVTGVDNCEHISCVTSDHVWVGDDNIILINTAGDILHHLKNFCFEIYSGGIQTVNSECELIYIDEDYNINKLSNDMKITTTIIEKTESKWEPHCVLWSQSNGDLLVGMYREDTNIGKVTRYNQTRELTQTIEHDDRGLELYKNPTFLAENNNGDVVVSDDLSAVVVTDREGRHRFSYTGHPSGSGLSPCGICTDALSNILVCDIRTNTIQIIDKNGQFLSYLLTKSEDIDEPRSLCYDINTHHLWVGSDNSNKLFVYRYITQQDNKTAEHRSCSAEEAFSCSRPA